MNMNESEKPVPSNSDKPKNDPQKIVVFCMSKSVAKRIAGHLEKQKALVWIVNHENDLFSQLDEADPELIFIEANAPTNIALDVITERIFEWMKKRSREINEFLSSPSQYSWQHAQIIFFESGREFTASGSLSADMADTEYLIKQCSVWGEVHHIGAYSPLNFMEEVRPFLRRY